MKRIDTLSEKAKAIYYETVELARKLGRMLYCCVDLPCEECPFYNKPNSCKEKGARKSRTVDEWKAWADEEIEEDN